MSKPLSLLLLAIILVVLKLFFGDEIFEIPEKTSYQQQKEVKKFRENLTQKNTPEVFSEKKGEKIIAETLSQKPKSQNDFTQKNFPKRCAWEPLDSVFDGDTISLATHPKKTKVRFIGINTPEIKGPYTKEQPFGEKASQTMKNFLRDEKMVCLIEDQIGNKYDKYGRKLAYVFRQDGLDLNGEMVRLGLARVYRKFPAERKNEFLRYEQIARSTLRGLWASDL